MMDTDMGLDFKCDYADAILEEIWQKSNKLLAKKKDSEEIRVFLGFLERKALEVWLQQRGGYASMLTLPGLGPVGCAPEVFGFPITFVKMDEHLKVRTWK